MAIADANFSGAIPQLYERHFGPALFGPFAADIVRRLDGISSGSLLEIAAGTGIVTAALARALPSAVKITASDLNQPMLDFAATKPGLERVRWRQADAMHLPFVDAAFDIVICQFGVMFFPDRIQAHAEASRVLKHPGRYIFNVWDSLAHNPAAECAQRAVAELYPKNPPGFIGRTPFGYHDPKTIRSDLRRAGFAKSTIETVKRTWLAPSSRDPAIAFCQGTPLRAEIEAIDPNGPAKATEAVERAIAARFGNGPVSLPMQGFVVEARR